MNQITYMACLSRGDAEYHIGTYKTYGGARRRISRSMGYGSRYDGWAIERRETVKTPETRLGFYFGMNSCILAQSRDWKFNLTVIRRDRAVTA